MAEHRNDPLRLNSSYKQIGRVFLANRKIKNINILFEDDPRRQLRFVEDIDKSANAKREASEKEALLKLTKSKGKDKDTREKVKEVLKTLFQQQMNGFRFNGQTGKQLQTAIQMQLHLPH
jgi:hypothetical protein